MKNWRNRSASLSSYEFVEEPLYCVLTRVELNSMMALPSMWRAYRQVRNEAHDVANLVRCAFLVSGPRTFVILSIWNDETGFVDFGTRVRHHLNAARQALAKSDSPGNMPKIWSTQWQICATSHNLNWGDSKDWDGLRKRRGEREESMDTRAESVS